MRPDITPHVSHACVTYLGDHYESHIEAYLYQAQVFWPLTCLRDETWWTYEVSDIYSSFKQYLHGVSICQWSSLNSFWSLSPPASPFTRAAHWTCRYRNEVESQYTAMRLPCLHKTWTQSSKSYNDPHIVGIIIYSSHWIVSSCQRKLATQFQEALQHDSLFVQSKCLTHPLNPKIQPSPSQDIVCHLLQLNILS